jgi:hypothetical protein
LSGLLSRIPRVDFRLKDFHGSRKLSTRNISLEEHSNTPTLQHSNTPTLQYSNTPILQYSSTPDSWLDSCLEDFQ